MQQTEHKRLEPKLRNHGKGRPTYSRFTGVSWHRKKRVWVAFIIRDGRQQHIGSYPSTRAGEIEAAESRDHALRLRGILSNLNFPD